MVHIIQVRTVSMNPNQYERRSKRIELPNSIESCRKIEQAKTNDGLMADGLNKVIMD